MVSKNLSRRLMATKSKHLKSKSSKYYKCKQCLGYVLNSRRKSHRCEKPSEESVFENLVEEPREAWIKLRKFASSLGPQKIYCSAKAVMFSRNVCYMFVRCKKSRIELCIMLDHKLDHEQIKKVDAYSKTRFRHIINVHHEDLIEGPLTEWILQAWKVALKA